MESAELCNASALAIRKGHPVLVVRTGLLDSTDFQLLRSVLGCVTGTVDPALANDSSAFEFR